MRVTMLAAAVLAAAAAATSAQAQGGIDPQCAKMGDKIGCTCALQNGGRIEPGGRRWTYPNRSVSAFASCKERFGRR